jgi:hypothetical protein
VQHTPWRNQAEQGLNGALSLRLSPSSSFRRLPESSGRASARPIGSLSSAIFRASRAALDPGFRRGDGHTYPRPLNLRYTPLTSSNEGRDHEAFVKRDGARRPRDRSQASTRAASGLPPGPLRVPARSWLTLSDALSLRCLSAVWLRRCGDGRIGLESGARCVTQKTPRRRAERRPPYPATDTDTTGLRLSARRPSPSSWEGDTLFDIARAQ